MRENWVPRSSTAAIPLSAGCSYLWSLLPLHFWTRTDRIVSLFQKYRGLNNCSVQSIFKYHQNSLPRGVWFPFSLSVK